MLFSTQTSYAIRTYGIKGGVEFLAKAGFPAVDLSMFASGEENFFTEADIDLFIKTVKECGLVVNQAHAPADSKIFMEKLLPLFPRVFKYCGKIGIPRIIVHPYQPGPYYGHEKEIFDANIKMYSSFAPMAKENGVKICLENMWRNHPITGRIVDDICADPQEMANLYDALDDPEAFSVCVDIGHVALCNREPQDAIRIIGHDRLGAVHAHDVDYVDDLHVVPGAGKINWDAVCHALADIDYQGDFTLEADYFYNNFEVEFYPTVAKFMADRARFLAAKIDGYRK